MTIDKPWSVYATLLLGSVITVEAAAFQSPAMPSIAAYFGIGEDLAALIALLYYIGLAAFSPIFGKVADAFGRKKVITGGLLLFSLSELLAAVAPTYSVLLVARLLQGVSNAAILPMLLSYVAYLFPQEKRGMPLGVFAVTLSLCAAMGGVLGGVLVDHFGWRSIYWVSCVGGALGFLLLKWRTPETPLSPDPFHLNIWGVCWLLVGIGSLLSLPTWISHAGLVSTATFCTLAVAIAGITALLRNEKRALSPIFDIEILSRKAFLLPCLIYLLFLICHNGSLYTLAFFINNRPGGSASQVGLTNTFMFCAGMIAGLVSGKLVEVLRERTVIIIVIGIAISALICFASINIDTPLWAIISIMTALGFAQGLKGPAVAKLALSTLPPHRYSTGSGLYSMLRDLGSPAGIGIGLAIFSSQRITATHGAIAKKAAEMGLDAALLPQIYQAVEVGELNAASELSIKLSEAGIDFQALVAAARIDGLSGTLPVVGSLLIATMVIALLLATRLPKR